MKVTKYFEFRSDFPDRVEIMDDWILRAIDIPIKTETQKDGRIRMWSKIEEAGDKYLRVVTLEDRKTVHNAFFDRNFKEEK